MLSDEKAIGIIFVYLGRMAMSINWYCITWKCVRHAGRLEFRKNIGKV
jgi:hypothetical protein